mgnify:FL=1
MPPDNAAKSSNDEATTMTKFGPDWRATALSLLVVIGCTETQTPVGLDGTLNVFGGGPDNPIFGRTSDWVSLGADDTVSYKTVYPVGTPALEIRGGSENAARIRRVDAQLLATPFLFWSWNIVNGPPRHPVRLVVGFADADTPTEAPSGMKTFLRGAQPPAFSRSLTLIWGSSALQRGTLTTDRATADEKSRAAYVVRGGRENRNRWWVENLDLSHLHAQAWPEIDMANSRIVFTGISATGDIGTGTMQISGLRLSR